MMDPFTYEEYRFILGTMKEKRYNFVGYHHPNPFNLPVPICMLRHDVDFDIGKALSLAKIEKQEKVNSTFCIQVRSRFYNPFSKSGTEMIEEIVDNGHWLGLHFDCSSYNDSPFLEDFKEACEREVEVLEKWFKVKLVLVSFHRPSSLVLSGIQINGLPSPYEKRFMRDMTYRSDSAGVWRFGHPIESEAFLNVEPLNLCIHPEWWGDKYQSCVYSIREIMVKRWKEFGEDFIINATGMV